MTHDEMRFLRRQFINELLQVRYDNGMLKNSLREIKKFTRQDEVLHYGYELQAYA